MFACFAGFQWDEFMELSKDVTDEVLQARIDNLVPNQCCTLIYTVSHCGYVLFCVYNTETKAYRT